MQTEYQCFEPFILGASQFERARYDACLDNLIRSELFIVDVENSDMIAVLTNNQFVRVEFYAIYIACGPVWPESE